MNIRTAEKKDIPALIELLHQVLEIHALHYPHIFKKGTTKYSKEDLMNLLSDADRTIFVAADENDHCVGYAFTEYIRNPDTPNMYAENVLYLDDLCVSETCRGQHIGELLFNRVREYARERDCRRVTLNVWSANAGAGAFYEKMGMTPVKTMMEYVIDKKSEKGGQD